MRRVWNKYSHAEIGRFVDADSIRMLPLGIDREALLRDPAGRRRLVEVIYGRLCERGIHYALERYHPDAREQEVRSAFEVLESPGDGTCLDLTALFAGLCLGFDLIPVIVLTERHAFCLVSLGHRSRDWQQFDRTEYTLFESLVADPAPLRELVDTGRYLALECTGFARSGSLPPDSVEGAGRVDGLLPFDAAVVAGRRQLDEPIRFALDLSVAQHGWGVIPWQLPPDLKIATERYVATLVGGGFQLDRAVDSAPAILPLPRPVAPLLRPNPIFVDRIPDVAALRAMLAPGRPAWVAGERGIGKTATLRHLAHDDPTALATRFPDGVVALRDVDDPRDGIRELYAAFHAVPPGFALTHAVMSRGLAGLHALVVADRLPAAVVEHLADSMPTATIVAVEVDGSRPGAGVVLDGLPPADAIELFRFECGDLSDTATNEQLARIVADVDGRPSEVLSAARLVRDGDVTIAELAADGAVRPSARRLASLDEVERRVVEFLDTVGSAGVHRTVLAQLVSGDLDGALRNLVARRMVTTGSPRYHLVEQIGRLAQPGVLERRRRHVVDRCAAWIATAHPEEVAAALPELGAAFGWAVSSGDHAATIALGRGLDGPLALLHRWGAWERVQSSTRAAAEALGDSASVAHTLHQEGARLALEGDRKGARALSERALALRRSTGDTTGAAVTRHNIDALRRGLGTWLKGVGAGVATILLVTIGVQLGGTGPSTTDPTVAPTVTAGPTTATTTTDVTPTDPPVTTAATTVATTSVPTTTSMAPTTTEPTLVAADIEPETVDFGRVAVDDARTVPVQVTNRGNVPITLVAADPSSDEFGLADHDCTDVAPGTSCQVQLVFAPVETGDRAGEVALTVEGPGGVLGRAIDVFGEAFRPATFEIEQDSIDLGIVRAERNDLVIGVRRPAVPTPVPTDVGRLVVVNTGTEPGRLDVALTVGGDAGWSIVADGCAGEIDGGASCDLDIGFGIGRDPADGTELRSHAGELTLTADGAAPLIVPLFVESAFEEPDLTIEIVRVSDVRVLGDEILARVEAVVDNHGLTATTTAGPIRADFFPSGFASWFSAGVDDVTVLTGVPIPALGSVSFTTVVTVSLTFVEREESIDIRLTVDECIGEFDPVECVVPETLETNNVSQGVRIRDATQVLAP